MNAIVISLDCVRHEALSLYPESFQWRNRFPYRAKTPNIDALAAEGAVFHNAYCQAPFTPASHASLFTGQNPYRHGIRGMFGYKLDDDVRTMAEQFSTAGFETGGFIGAHALSSEYGLHRGFDTYDEEFEDAAKNWVVGNRRPGSEVTNRALNWLNERESDFLLFLHYFDAHDGGTTPADVDETDEATGDGIRGLYDRYVRSIDEGLGGPIKRGYRTLRKLDPNRAYGRRYHLRQVQRVDEQVGRIIDVLRDRGEYDQTTIVVFADHGDAFGEHGEYGHRKYIYDTTIRVPLVVKPGEETDADLGRTDRVVRLIDVYPTLAEAADLSTDSVEGKSLYEAFEGDADGRKAYAETRMEDSPNNLGNLVSDQVGLRDGRWKLIQDRLDDSSELYDLEADPEEHHEVADEYPSVRSGLVAELDELTAGSEGKAATLMDDTERAAVEDRLEGLGYL